MASLWTSAVIMKVPNHFRCARHHGISVDRLYGGDSDSTVTLKLNVNAAQQLHELPGAQRNDSKSRPHQANASRASVTCNVN